MGIISAYGVLFFSLQRMTKYDPHSPAYTMVTSQKVQHKLNCAQVTMQYPYDQLYMYIYRVVQFISTPSHWNLIGYSTTVQFACIISQQYSSATFISLCFPYQKGKFGMYFKSVIFFITTLLL